MPLFMQFGLFRQLAPAPGASAIFTGDNTGATDVSAAMATQHDAQGQLILPPGTYRASVTTTKVPRFSAQVPGTVKWLYDAGKSAILFDPPIAEVVSASVSITSITKSVLAGIDDRLDRIGVSAIPSGLQPGDMILLGSNNAIASDATRWAGETAIVAFIDTQNNYIFTAMPLLYDSNYTTNPILSRWTMQHADGFVHGIEFKSNGNYLDASITDRRPAIDITGAPYFLIDQACKFTETWGQAFVYKSCPASRALFNHNRKLPNIATYDPNTASNGNKIVTSATNANPGVFTRAAHGFSNNKVVYLRNATGGFSALNGKTYKITVINSSTFSLQSIDGTVIDTTALGAYNGDLEVSNADVRGFGYAGSVYGPSAFCFIVGSWTLNSRHDSTTDGRGSSYSPNTDRHRYGQPTYISRNTSVTFAGIGPPSDGHEEASRLEDSNRTVFGAIRGPQGGTYPSMADHMARAKGSVATEQRFYDVGIGVRQDPILHEVVPVHHRNNVFMDNLKDNSNTGCAYLSDDLSALVNKPIMNARDWTVFGAQRPYRFGGGTIFRGRGTHIVYGPEIRTVMFEGPGNTIDFDELEVDYRGTTITGNPNCRVIYVDGNGTTPLLNNILRIGHLRLVLGDGTTKPNTLIDLNGTDTAGALTLQLGRLSVVNPSNIAIPPLCGPTKYAGLKLDLKGMDVIELKLNQPQTVLTTSMKASKLIGRNFIPAYYEAYVDAASSSGAPVFDLQKNGSSIFGASKLTVDQGATNSRASAAPVTISTASLTPYASGDVLTAIATAAGTSTQGGTINVYGWYV